MAAREVKILRIMKMRVKRVKKKQKKKLMRKSLTELISITCSWVLTKDLEDKELQKLSILQMKENKGLLPHSKSKKPEKVQSAKRCACY
eukprot:CAMPEP_0116878906 /NCGR_PEP_ID=MMETSP0463-20121206/10655_1 /TAXON_ID=181622 /ORGANISM="Strombidinopsis sp, Strain SopsisLIS2011" /LENGTH=88 /DNA_ID=CAMNT_0004527593 /DNA_START=690 /DNA_END=956 /DNA_ORIENTATION=-